MLKILVHAIHGKNPHWFPVVCVYSIGVFAAGVYGLYVEELSLYEKIICIFLAFDIYGGVVANATEKTHSWWKAQASYVQSSFICAHFVHFLCISHFLHIHPSIFMNALFAALCIKLLLFVR